MAKESGYKQGEYKLINPAKYRGKHAPVYRSGYELKFFRWCDLHPRVIEWGSETLVIPYVSPIDGRIHRYFVDNVVRFRKDDGTSQTFVIEVKPSSQTQPPDLNTRKKNKTKLYEAKTWVINSAKWAAAKAYCSNKGYTFQILTEKELFI